MQGNIPFPVLPLLTDKTTVPKFSVISTFHVFFFFFSHFRKILFWSFYHISTVSPLCLLSQGWQCTQCPQPLALTCPPTPPPVKFFGFDPGAAGLPCMSALALASVWVGLCPFGRATFIGWCPLEPPCWSLGVVR